VAELASRFHQAQLVATSDTKEQSENNHLGKLKAPLYTWDFLSDDKENSDLSLRVEPTKWTPMIVADDNVYAKPWKTTGDL
jgi:hypothetical protein